jgi:hypothetical protein
LVLTVPLRAHRRGSKLIVRDKIPSTLSGSTQHMFFARHRLLAGLVGLISLGAVARVQAGLLYETNNSPSTASVLPVDMYTVISSLDPVLPETIFGEFDPAYQTLLQMSPSGNGTVTEWDGVPLRFNGSQYFRVSGIGDVNFTGDHTQTGKFSYEFKVYDAQHNLLQTTISTASIIAKTAINNGTVKNIWVNPANSQIGGTVDVIVTDLVTKGDTDFYTFSGLQAGQSFTANISGESFLPRLGLWSDSRTNTASVNGSILTGKANSLGQVLIGVTAQGDTNFTGAQTASGAYSLVVTPGTIPTPEPGSIVLLGLGGMLAIFFRRYRRGRRPPIDSAPLG